MHVLHLPSLTRNRDRWRFILDHYYKPWPHLPSYCIGLALGFLLASRARLALTRAQMRTCWLFVTLFCLASLYGVYPWNMGWKVGPAVTALYAATFRSIWSGCCAWTVFALLRHDSHTLMARVLSWKGFLPFSRVTYSAFLLHPFVIWFHSGSLRERFTPSHFNYFHLFLGHYLLTYLLSFAFGLLFESPFMALQKVLFAGRDCDRRQAAPSVPPPLLSTRTPADGLTPFSLAIGRESRARTQPRPVIGKRSFVYSVKNSSPSSTLCV